MPTTTGVVMASRYIRRMRGGAQAHLLRCSDGKDYVVKFQNNPQGVKILANEFIFSNLGRSLGFTLARNKIVVVEDSFIRNNAQLNFWVPDAPFIPCEAGLQFGSELVVNVLEGRIEPMLRFPVSQVRNAHEFAGMLVLDKWTCNLDARQAVLWRLCRQKKYTATFIDHGWCFGASEWSFSDNRPRAGAFLKKIVYAGISGWHSFEPWLSKLEALDSDTIWSAVENTPPEWYRSDWSALERLAETLVTRRRIIRELISDFRFSTHNPFPNWRNSQAA